MGFGRSYVSNFDDDPTCGYGNGEASGRGEIDCDGEGYGNSLGAGDASYKGYG